MRFKGLTILAVIIVGCAASRQDKVDIQDHTKPLPFPSKPATTESVKYEEQGIASFMADELHGKKTASGEEFDMRELTAAHKHLPFGTIVRVTNLKNQKSVEVRINDRGPYVRDRIIDVSFEAAKRLGFVNEGTAPVKITVIKLGK